MKPHLVDVRPQLAAVRQRTAALIAHRGPCVDRITERLTDVVLVASSSRGGSSVFTETLRASPDLLHLQAELNPLLTLAGLHPLDQNSLSDAIVEHPNFDRDRLDTALALDAGHRQTGPVDLDRWATDLCFRLTIQWPTETFRLPAVRTAIHAAWAACSPPRSGLPAHLLATVHHAFLQRIHQDHPTVDPRLYDLDRTRLEGFALPAVPVGPTGAVVEEPPFVTVGPWQRVTERTLNRPLIIKTPSNAYRLPFLTAVFPAARVRILHLTRNPAASINGLVDGWNYPGFHAHRVHPPLNTPGYATHRPQDRHYFKYDLFPGWQDHVHRPLAELAAHQWAAAHTHILDHLAAHPEVSTLRVRFEDVVGTRDVRHATFARIAAWLGVSIHPQLQAVIDTPLPPVMATARPRARRWFSRADELEPALALPAVRQMAATLGYADPHSWV